MTKAQTPQNHRLNTKTEEIGTSFEANYSDIATYMPYSALNPMHKRITPKELTAFSSSIQKIGFLDPLIINDNGDIIDGNKRYFAAVHLNIDYVPCIHCDAEYNPSYVDLLIALNDIGSHFFEKAKIMEILTEKYLFTQEKIAILLNCSQSYVANKLRLLKFSEYQMLTIKEGGLTERHARALLKIKNNELRTIAICHIRDEGMNVSAAEEYVDGLILENESKKAELYESGADIIKTCKEIEKLTDTARKSGIFLKISRTEDAHSINYVIKVFKN